MRDVEVKRLNREWRRATEVRLGLVLDGVVSPFNVGSILRTAAALGVEQVWLAGPTATPHLPAVRKVSMGTERLLRWHEGGTTLEGLAEARADGLRPVALELCDGAVPLHDAALAGAVCLVVGNEDKGLSPAVLATCEAAAYLPQPGKVGSLNVAVATGIALAECRRREWAAPAPTG
ncbi:MAG: TrmH family RNA methyltransferase [Acidimicrobiales bacterium]